MHTNTRLLVGLLIGIFACTPDSEQHFSEDTPFSERENYGLVSDEPLSEVSGLVASRKNPGALWVHNDSGHPAELYLISARGRLLATYRLPEAENVDWEDIAIGPGPEAGETYLYVADIGNNVWLHDEHAIYRCIEPTYTESASPVVDTIEYADRLTFSYAEGAIDAETLLLDPATQDLYVLSKELGQIQLYRLRFPEAPPFHQRVSRVAAFPFFGDDLLDRLVGGDLSADGTEVLLKTYEHVLYWNRKDTATALATLLPTPADTLPYQPEIQGEAVGFAANGSGYYTLSERSFGTDVYLYFYPRRPPDSTEVSQRATYPWYSNPH